MPAQPSRPWSRPLLPVLCLAMASLLTGCGGGQDTPTSPAPRQTVILGIDALDWQASTR